MLSSHHDDNQRFNKKRYLLQTRTSFVPTKSPTESQDTMTEPKQENRRNYNGRRKMSSSWVTGVGGALSVLVNPFSLVNPSLVSKTTRKIRERGDARNLHHRPHCSSCLCQNHRPHYHHHHRRQSGGISCHRRRCFHHPSHSLCRYRTFCARTHIGSSFQFQCRR